MHNHYDYALLLLLTLMPSLRQFLRHTQANSAILNTLLSLINERLFDNGSQRMPAPLITMVGRGVTQHSQQPAGHALRV